MIDQKIVEAAVPLWINGHRHSRCRYAHNDRPSEKGRSSPIAGTVDELLTQHGIGVGAHRAGMKVYMEYERAIRLRAQEAA